MEWLFEPKKRTKQPKARFLRKISELTSKMYPEITDFHTHNLHAKHAIINVPKEWLLQPTLFAPQGDAVYSVGIHPWWTENVAEIEKMLHNMPRLLLHPQVVAVGECGLDALRGAVLPQQIEVFKAQIKMAEVAQLPVTLHVVRCYDRILQLHKWLRPTTQWTVHGFRGKPILAQQLLQAGIDLSFGMHRNEESWQITPPHRRHVESDES